MSEKTNKELYAELHAILQKARDTVVEAEKFAEANNLQFYLDITGIGFGVDYYPHNAKVRSKHNEEMVNNDMVAGEECRECGELHEDCECEEKRIIEPLKEHVTEGTVGGYDTVDFNGGWWIPSRIC